MAGGLRFRYWFPGGAGQYSARTLIGRVGIRAGRCPGCVLSIFSLLSIFIYILGACVPERSGFALVSSRHLLHYITHGGYIRWFL